MFLSGLAGAFCGEHARDAGKIHRNCNVGPCSLRVENSANVVRGIVAEFEDQDAAITQQLARLVNQALVHFHAGWSAEECGVRFVVAHLTLQSGRVVARNVRWITDDQIEKWPILC